MTLMDIAQKSYAMRLEIGRAGSKEQKTNQTPSTRGVNIISMEKVLPEDG